MGIQIPSEVATKVDHELPGVTDSPQPVAEGLDHIIPVWQVADSSLDQGTRAREAKNLALRLEELVGATHQDVSPADLTVRAAVKQIARDNGIAIEIPAPSASPGALSDGLIATSSQPSLGDPHATWMAIELGWTVPDRGLETISSSAGPSGWMQKAPVPDPETTYFGVMLARSTGQAFDQKAVSAEESAWLDGIAQGGVKGGEGRRAYFIVSLAKSLGRPIPEGVVTALRNRASKLSSGDTDTLSFAAMAPLIGLPIRPALAPSYVSAATFGSVPEAYAAWLWGQALGLNDTCARSKDYVGTRRLASGAFSSDASHEPDLFSNAIARRLGQLSAGGSEVSALFADDRGYWHYPAASPDNVMDLQGFYLAAYLAGRVDDPEGVF
jgi:hypothetical protein